MQVNTYHIMNQGQIQPVSLGGGAVSVIFGSQVSLQVHYCEMKYTSKHCCDKTTDNKLSLYPGFF